MMNTTKRIRILTVICLLVIIPLGFGSKFYAGPYQRWVNNSLSGVFYEIFWCLLALLVFPKTKILRIAVIVFLSTCLLEFLQLWHPPFLQMLRSTFIGVTILGNSFVVSDFLYYFIGSALGWLLLLRLRNL